MVTYRFIALCAVVFGIAQMAHASERVVSEESLKSYTITDEIAVNAALTDQAGDPVNGRKIAINRKKGNCLACHVMPVPEQQFHGETGPSLLGVASILSEGEIRMQVINSKVVNPDSMMPSFYRVTGYTRPAKKFIGKTILSAQEVEDVVAYLATFTSE